MTPEPVHGFRMPASASNLPTISEGGLSSSLFGQTPTFSFGDINQHQESQIRASLASSKKRRRTNECSDPNPN